uniref:Uncharacterized protein n=1 Tax=Anopheles culicifacies TaxID=139723 RepID=A0A182MMH4_9DIPT
MNGFTGGRFTGVTMSCIRLPPPADGGTVVAVSGGAPAGTPALIARLDLLTGVMATGLGAINRCGSDYCTDCFLLLSLPVAQFAEMLLACVARVLFILFRIIAAHDVQYFRRVHGCQSQIAHLLRGESLLQDKVTLLHINRTPHQIWILALETLHAQVLRDLLLDHIRIGTSGARAWRRPFVLR